MQGGDRGRKQLLGGSERLWVRADPPGSGMKPSSDTVCSLIPCLSPHPPPTREAKQYVVLGIQAYVIKLPPLPQPSN